MRNKVLPATRTVAITAVVRPAWDGAHEPWIALLFFDGMATDVKWANSCASACATVRECWQVEPVAVTLREEAEAVRARAGNKGGEHG